MAYAQLKKRKIYVIVSIKKCFRKLALDPDEVFAMKCNY